LLGVLKKEQTIEPILNELFYSFKSGTIYEEHLPIPLTEEEIKQGLSTKYETVQYKLSIREKKQLGIEGVVYRTSKLYYNNLVEGDSLVTSAVKNTDGIRFYFDLYKEYVGFNTKQRFGYQQFVNSFENIINLCIKNTGKQYKFSVSLYTEGLNLDEIKDELRKIRNIERLDIYVQPPNPDEDTLSQIESSLGRRLNEFKDANASSITTTIRADGKDALKIDSKLIENELELIEEAHKSVGIKKATSRGCF